MGPYKSALIAAPLTATAVPQKRTKERRSSLLYCGAPLKFGLNQSPQEKQRNKKKFNFLFFLLRLPAEVAAEERRIWRRSSRLYVAIEALLYDPGNNGREYNIEDLALPINYRDGAR